MNETTYIMYRLKWKEVEAGRFECMGGGSGGKGGRPRGEVVGEGK